MCFAGVFGDLIPRGQKSLSEIVQAAVMAITQPGEGLLDRASALSHERLFGANRLGFSRRPGKGLRRRRRDQRRMVERRIRAAHFSAVKSFDTFDFTAIPSLNKPLTLELARCEYLIARDNVIALGNSGTGKTHACLALGLAACQRGFPVSFFTAAGLVHQLMEARDERRLLKLQAQLAAVKLLIVDELGYVP